MHKTKSLIVPKAQYHFKPGIFIIVHKLLATLKVKFSDCRFKRLTIIFLAFIGCRLLAKTQPDTFSKHCIHPHMDILANHKT